MRLSLSAAVVSAAAVLTVSACAGGEDVDAEEAGDAVEATEATQVPEGYDVVVEFLEDQAAATRAVVDYDAEAGNDAELQGLLEEVEEINDGWRGDSWPDVSADASDGVEVAQVASDLEDESGWLAHVMLDPGETLESDDLEAARDAVEAAEELVESL